MSQPTSPEHQSDCVTCAAQGGAGVTFHRYKAPDYKLSQTQIANFALQHGCSMKEVCVIDGKKIEVMAFKNTGVCCERCRKVRDGEPIDQPLRISSF